MEVTKAYLDALKLERLDPLAILKGGVKYPLLSLYESHTEDSLKVIYQLPNELLPRSGSGGCLPGSCSHTLADLDDVYPLKKKDINVIVARIIEKDPIGETDAA